MREDFRTSIERGHILDLLGEERAWLPSSLLPHVELETLCPRFPLEIACLCCQKRHRCASGCFCIFQLTQCLPPPLPPPLPPLPPPPSHVVFLPPPRAPRSAACLSCATQINRSVSLRLAVPVVLPVARPWVPSPTRPRRRRSKAVGSRLAKRGQHIMHVHVLYIIHVCTRVLYIYYI